jgi:WD40 repeat protein
MKLPPGDKSSNKLNGLQWAPSGQFETRIGYVRQDHMFGVMDVTKNNGVWGGKAPWAQCIAMHPSVDGIIATGGMENATKLWAKSDTPGKVANTKTIIEHDGYIASLFFLNGGNDYISASGDSDIRVIDVEKGTTKLRFCGHDKDAQSLCFPADTPGGKRFATCSSDKTVKLWDLTSGKCTHTFLTDSELNACSMFPNGEMVACGGEKDKTYILDVRAYKQVSKYARNNQKTASCQFSRSGRQLYVGHDDGALITWDIFDDGANKNYASKIEAHTNFYPGTQKPDITSSRVQAMDVNADGVLATCGFDGKLKIWSAPPEAAN